MPAPVVLQVENLSKLYRLGLIGGGTLREDVQRWWARLRGRENPFLTRAGEDEGWGTEEYIWALHDVNLEVREGEILGLIGANGAGKSTLLKILSRVTAPTTGTARMKGRVSALLEVGTGFHPELSGRDNIYLNGAILGMNHAEVEAKFDEIVAFSEVGRFIDTPVKRYSSGMYVRLAFAVAAHLEPEILLVDEVLAVGDAAFQNKCLGKMGQVARGGRTVLFVSHNMASVQSLCDRVCVIQEGRIVHEGDPEGSVQFYLEDGAEHPEGDGPISIDSSQFDRFGGEEFRITGVRVVDAGGRPVKRVHTGQDLVVRVGYASDNQPISPAVRVIVRDERGVEVFRVATQPISGFPLEDLGRSGTLELELPDLPLTAGLYYVDLAFASRAGFRMTHEWERVLRIRVEEHDVYGSGFALDRSRGLITVRHRWSHAPGTVDDRPDDPGLSPPAP